MLSIYYTFVDPSHLFIEGVPVQVTNIGHSRMYEKDLYWNTFCPYHIDD